MVDRDEPAPKIEHAALIPIGLYLALLYVAGVAMSPVYGAVSAFLGGFIVPVGAITAVLGFVPFCWAYAKLGGR